MIAVVQRVLKSSVTVEENCVGSIEKGLTIFLGISEDDTQKDVLFLGQKLSALRIFEDENGKMNRSVLDVEGEMLVISQFTLLANCQRGNRPNFIGAAKPDVAYPLYENFIEQVKNCGVKKVEAGVFGAEMKVEIINDGPVTIVLNSKEFLK